jgi:alpha-ketoglutarate-dependent taurine dioxygenase
LGELTGRPESSTLHIHPILNNESKFNIGTDSQISTISSLYRKNRIDLKPALRKNTKNTEASWHSDIQFEEVPADYTSLRIVQNPKNGGDTLWASGKI